MQVRNFDIDKFIKRVVKFKLNRHGKDVIKNCLENEEKEICQAVESFKKEKQKTVVLTISKEINRIIDAFLGFIDNPENAKKEIEDLKIQIKKSLTKREEIERLLGNSRLSFFKNQIIEQIDELFEEDKRQQKQPLSEEDKKQLQSKYPKVDIQYNDGYDNLYAFLEKSYDEKTLAVLGGPTQVISTQYFSEYQREIETIANLISIKGDSIEFTEDGLELNYGIGVFGEDAPQNINFEISKLKNKVVVTSADKHTVVEKNQPSKLHSKTENKENEDTQTKEENKKIDDDNKNEEIKKISKPEFQEPEIDNELDLIIVCQKIKDEIARLENDRTAWLFVNATEQKVNILNRLLQIISAPDSFSQEYRRKYFGDNEHNDLKSIISNLENDIQFRNSEGENVENKSLISEAMNVFGSDSTVSSFITELSKEHGSLRISSSKPVKTKPKDKIEYEEVIVFGDSLTDIDLMRRGPFGDYCGLKDNSPYGSFTNGRSWFYHFVNDLYNRSRNFGSELLTKILPNNINPDASTITLHKVGNKKLYTCEIVDFNNQKELYEFKLEDIDECDVFSINGKIVARSYAIGGATAYDYKHKLSGNIKQDFTRLIVSRLSDQREKFFAHEAKNISSTPKNKKLFIDWIGANDLITVNEAPTLLEADNLIKAKMEHYEAMIKAGYTNFVIMNLPDLSLTPRYQRIGGQAVTNAHLVTEYVNRQIAMHALELKKIYPKCQIDICDINSKFTNAINGLKEGGEAAKPYEKYINRYYDLEYKENLSSNTKIEKNKFIYSIVEKDIVNILDTEHFLKYAVIDACGQRREREISLDKLFSDEKEKLNFINNHEITDLLKKKIFAITNEIGDTIPEDDIFKPLKETIAFERYQKELAAKNQNIETNHLLPGVNRIFFDDVHPSADMHAFLFEEVRSFIEKKYDFTPVKPRQKKDENKTKDDLAIAQNKPEKKFTEKELVAQFLRKYLYQFNLERNGLFGWFRQRKLKWDNNKIELKEIYNHALQPTDGTGERTKDILKSMGLIADNGTVPDEYKKYLNNNPSNIEVVNSRK